MSEHPPKKLDLDLSNEETMEPALDLDLSNEAATKESLDAAESAAKIQAIKDYLEANQRKIADAEAKREVEERLGIEHFAQAIGDSENIEGTMLQTGMNEAAVRRYEERRAEAQSTEANPFTPNVTDMQEVLAARAQEAKEKAEMKEALEKLRKAA